MVGRLPSQPDEIRHELRVVLRHGLRPARVERCLEQLPALLGLASTAVDATRRFDAAIRICEEIESGIRGFGDGPFGLALQELFGLRAGTRGLNLDTRRSAAAATLGLQVATVARHWEKDALADLAVALYRP